VAEILQPLAFLRRIRFLLTFSSEAAAAVVGLEPFRPQGLTVAVLILVYLPIGWTKAA
jgi:hypothetical protein